MTRTRRVWCGEALTSTVYGVAVLMMLPCQVAVCLAPKLLSGVYVQVCRLPSHYE